MSGPRDIQHDARGRQIKLVTKLQVEAAGGTKALTIYGTRQQRLSDCQNPNTPDFVRLDEAELLDAQAGTPRFARWLAQRAGYELVKLPDPSLPDTIWSQRLGTLLKEVGDLSTGMGAAIATDSGAGDVSDIAPKEAQALLQDADELVAAAVEIQQALKRRAEGLF